tara:strand:+ start:7056 stop:7316 length:261 start_codon:yes stop_codon:yes gene_type:complete
LLELAIDEWSERLQGLTGEQIKHGLDKLDGEWVPTPMSFRTLCTGDDGLHSTGAYREFDKSKAIEHKADKGKAKAQMDEIKKLLNK